MKYIAAWSGILGAIVFALASIIGGLNIEGYDVISQYISESYATGIPNAHYLQKAFMVSGVLLALFGFLGSSVFPRSNAIKIGFVLFGICYGLGTLTTGIFPCDIGCEPDSENPSLSQFIHNASGTLAYSIVPFCILGLGITFKKWRETKKLVSLSLICGTISFVFVILLFGDPVGPYRGLFQRIIEGGILFWIIGTSIFILRNGVNKKNL